MTPQEAEQIMTPFYPHDPNLAMKALDKALGGTVPEWMIESVVGSYFTFLHVKELEAKIMTLEMRNQDPFGLNTVLYTLVDRPEGDAEVEFN